MTAVARNDRSRGQAGLAQAVRMEWIKLRSLRSTWWTLAITAAGTIAIGTAVGHDTVNPASDVTNNSLAGVVPGLLLAGALGVLTMTSEYSSGMIRATLAAVPRRPLVLAGKAVVLGGVALVAGEFASFASFFAGTAALRHGIPAPTLGQPGVLRAVTACGLGYCLIGLLGLGLGAIIRHSAAALGVLAGGVYVAATFLADTARGLGAYTPIIIVGNSLSTVKPQSCAGHGSPCPHILSAGTGFAVLCLWAAVPLAVGAWMLTRRDA
jgi:ABC-2 type transport system permease protein